MNITFAPSYKTTQSSHFSKHQKQSFKGGSKLVAEAPKKLPKLTLFDNAMIKLAEFKPLKSLVEWASKDKNKNILSQGLMITYSALLQASYIINILKDKKMPEERKEVLITTQVLTFIIPTLGALVVDDTINKGYEKFVKYLQNNNKGLTSLKKGGKALEGLMLLKTVFIFAMMYKIMSTIVALPISNKITEKLHEKGILGKTQEESSFKADA